MQEVVRPYQTEAKGVTVTEGTLRVKLSDGRTVSVPLAWYPWDPRLVDAAQDERDAWELIDEGREFAGRLWTKT